MRTFLTIALVLATLVGSLEFSTPVSAEECHGSACIQSADISHNQVNSGNPDDSGTDCSTHKECMQCHFGHCHHALTNNSIAFRPYLSSGELAEKFSKYQEIYLPGFNRPPIA